MNKVGSVVGGLFLIFFIPFTELVTLRLLIPKPLVWEHLSLLFSPGKIFFVLIPIVVALTLFILLLRKRGLFIQMRAQRKTLITNGLFFLIFLGISLNLGFLEVRLGKTLLSYLWYFLGLVVFVTSFFCFLNLRGLVTNIIKNPLEIAFGLGFGCLYGLFNFSIEHLWKVLAAPTTLASVSIVGLLGYDMSAKGNMVEHALFTEEVAPVCSGLEGIFLFIFIFSLILILDWNSYVKKQAFLIYLIGIIYMIFLNILRISAFLIARVEAIGIWGDTEANELFVWFFHANVGWIFYLIGIGIFFTILFRFKIGIVRNSSS